MGAVHIGVGHDDNAVVTQFVGVVFLAPDATAEGGDERADFLRTDHLVETRLLDVEDLALERQDRLGAAITPLLGGTARRVPFHQKQFGQGRVFFLTIRQFAGQASNVQSPFAAGHFTRLAGGFAGAGSFDHLACHQFGLAGVFQQEFGQFVVHGRFDHALDFGRYQFVLGLGGELGVGYFHRQHGSQTFAGVVTRRADFFLFRQTRLLDVAVEGTGEGSAETGQMRTTIALRDIVGVTEHVFLIGVVPLQGDFHPHAILFGAEIDDVGVDWVLVAVEVLHERLDATFVLKHVFAAFTPAVNQVDAYPGVEERQLAQALGEDVVVEFGLGEDRGARVKAYCCSRTRAVTDFSQWRFRFAQMVNLPVELAIAADGQFQFVGKSIHHRYPNPVQAAGYFVRVVIKLAACVQDGHDNLRRRASFFRMDVDRNTTPVIGYLHRAITE